MDGCKLKYTAKQTIRTILLSEYKGACCQRRVRSQSQNYWQCSRVREFFVNIFMPFIYHVYMFMYKMYTSI